MKIQKIEQIEKISYKSFRRVKICGDHIQVTAMSSHSAKCPILKLSKLNYLVMETGEVKQFIENTKRIDNLNEIKESMKRLRDIVNSNITAENIHCCKWITLTYAENMTDVKQLKKDFEKFNKKMHYKYGDYEYIDAVEPQDRGAWHHHLLLIFPDTAPFIPNAELAKLWSHGFTKTKALTKSDNIGSYLCAYLSNMPELTLERDADGNIIKDADGNMYLVENKTSKKYMKNIRLFFYPKGMRFYRTSRGIKRPIEKNMSSNQLTQFLKKSQAKKTYETAFKITLDSGFEIEIKKTYYKKENILSPLELLPDYDNPFLEYKQMQMTELYG